MDGSLNRGRPLLLLRQLVILSFALVIGGLILDGMSFLSVVNEYQYSYTLFLGYFVSDGCDGSGVHFTSFEPCGSLA